MSFFSFKKKKGESHSCCGGNFSNESMKNADSLKSCDSKIKILGIGCKKCNELKELTTQALKELGVPYEVEHISDFTQIASYGVMSTPALVIDGKVVSYGKILSKNEIIDLIKNNIQ